METLKRLGAVIQPLIIALLLVLLVLQRECSRCPEAVHTHSRTEVWRYDTVRYITEVAVAMPVEVIVEVEVPAVVDTAAILRDYFSAYVYDRILKDDSSAYIRLNDTVSRNRLRGATLEYVNRRPTQVVINTTMVDHPRVKVFAGPSIGYSLGGDFGLGVQGMLLTKRDHGYGLMVDPFNQRVEATALWKLSLKRKSLLK